MKKLSLGAFEELVLLAIGVLEDNAYGATIKFELEDQLKKSISLGALYGSLQRLEEKGWVTSRVGGITEKQGGRRKQYFDITKDGIQVIKEAKELRNDLFNRIPASKLDWIKS